MNKCIFLGRLTKDPELRYSQTADGQLAIVRYTLAVNRRFKRDGEPNADFIPCVAFGKTAEFAYKYFLKGQMVGASGRLQVRSYDDKDGVRRWSTEVIIEDQYFAEGKAQTGSNRGQNADNGQSEYDGFTPIDEDIEQDLPF